MSERYQVLLLALGLYLVACLWLGYVSWRRTRTRRGFFMANRNLGPFAVTMGLFASNFSGFAFVGGPGLVYATGAGSLWMLLCASFSVCLVFFLLAKRLRLLGEARDALSVPGVLAARFSSEGTRGLAAVAVLLGTVGYLGVQIRAMATLVQQLLVGSGAWSDAPLTACVGLSLGVVVLYGAFGGVLASVATDVLQGVVMITASVLVFFAATRVFEGGLPQAFAVVNGDDPSALSPFGTHGALVALSWYLLFALGAAGQPHYVSKLMMLRRPRDARYVLPLMLVAMTLASLLWFSVGFVMRAAVLDGRVAPLERPDLAAGTFLELFLHPAVAGIVSAGVLAAIMSSADSFLNVGAAALVDDLPRAFGLTPSSRLWPARVATLGLAAGAALVAWAWTDLIALLGALGWGILAAALTPLLALGLNWKRPSAPAANASLIVGLILAVLPGVLGWSLPGGVSWSVVALIAALGTFLLVGRLAPPARLDDDVEAVMDL